MNSVLECALSYAARGLHVLPLHHPVRQDRKMSCSCGRKDCGSAAKHPVGSLAPNGLKNATTDTATIERWFQQEMRNIGIVTGAVSGIVALDIDPRHDGDESLAALERQHGTLPPTWRFLTGGGGEHILFRHPGGHIANSTGKVGKGIDLRGDGGYIVAPPALHISGHHYAIDVDHHLDDVRLADAPAWLLNLILEQRVSPQRRALHYREMMQNGAIEGTRNSSIARLAGLLLSKGIDHYICLDLMFGFNKARCHPPLDDQEVAMIVANIARREYSKRGRDEKGEVHG
jgi:putative DNA primase/helicase